MFPYMDFIYSFVFVPGIILAMFGVFWIAGPMTLILLPLASIINYVMIREQLKNFKKKGLKVRKNIKGFLLYMLAYSLILQPASVYGYVREALFGSKKEWGTK